MTHFEEGGAIEQYSEADWVMGGVIDRDQVATPRHVYTGEQYNQNEYIQNTCTIYNAIGAYSDLRGIRVPLEQRKELVDLAVEQGLDPDIGWYIHKAIKLVADYFGDVSYAKTLVASEDYWKARELGFSLMGGYKGNRVYNADRDDNLIVDTNDWGDPAYAHALREITHDRKVDNYDYRHSNVYKYPDVEAKRESGNVFNWAYFYFDKVELPMSNLPEYITPESFETELGQQTAKAREQEMGVHLENGGKLLYNVYFSENQKDYPQILNRYLNDLAFFRNKNS